jgi:uncharacterized protein (TIGR00159 family)
MPQLIWLFSRLTFRDVVDILLVSLVFFWLLTLIHHTPAEQVLRGVIVVVIIGVVVAFVFNLPSFNWLLRNSLPALLIAVPVIFQPELRRALEQLGHAGSMLNRPLTSHTGATTETVVDQVVKACARLSERRYGALLVIERQTGLQDIADRGTKLDALVSVELLLTIFFPNSPLHDLAVIVRGDRLVAAGCPLPMSMSDSLDSSLGARHRAALGVTEVSDAVAVVVSEETGRISLATRGHMTSNLTPEKLRKLLLPLLRVSAVSEGLPSWMIRREAVAPERTGVAPSRTEGPAKVELTAAPGEPALKK